MEGFCKRPGPARPKLAACSFSSEEAKVSAGCGPRCLAKTCATISSACSAISSECEQAILCRLSVSLLPHLPSSPSLPLSLSPSPPLSLSPVCNVTHKLRGISTLTTYTSETMPRTNAGSRLTSARNSSPVPMPAAAVGSRPTRRARSWRWVMGCKACCGRVRGIHREGLVLSARSRSLV